MKKGMLALLIVPVFSVAMESSSEFSVAYGDNGNSIIGTHQKIDSNDDRLFTETTVTKSFVTQEITTKAQKIGGPFILDYPAVDPAIKSALIEKIEEFHLNNAFIKSPK